MKIYARMSRVPCYKLFPSEIITVDRWRYFVLWQLASAGGAWLMCSVLHADAHKQWALWLVGHLPNWICETMSAIWLVAVTATKLARHGARLLAGMWAITHFNNHRTKTLPCQTCFRPEMQPLLKNCLRQRQLQINSTGKNMKLKIYKGLISQENR